jgi:hypothetical protein
MEWSELLASLEVTEDEPKIRLSCEICGARTGELRRGRCWSCYSRWCESRPAGFGAACVVCGERRRAYLKLIELLGTFQPMCGNCGLRVTRLDRMPSSLEALRHSLRRDRRAGERRRGLVDLRGDPIERRGLPRRAVGTWAGGEICVDDHPEIVFELDDWDIEIEPEPGEETRIVERVLTRTV